LDVVAALAIRRRRLAEMRQRVDVSEVERWIVSGTLLQRPYR
jgi:hypothetical protein